MRVQKISVSGGFTCPNRDGSKAVGGCTYCNNESFSPAARNSYLTVAEQLGRGIEFYESRARKPQKYIAYFQSYSNTYKKVSELEKIYAEALSHPEVIGLSIGTRPDCVDQEKLQLIADIAKDYEVTLEYGLESFNDEVLKSINRADEVKTYYKAVEMAHKLDIELCTHLIFGLQGEEDQYWRHAAKELSRIEMKFVKIHQLHIVNNTKMANDYKKSPFPLYGQDEYLDIIHDFLVHLSDKVIIQRLKGKVPKNYLAVHDWDLSDSEFVQLLQQKMKREETYQGKCY